MIEQKKMMEAEVKVKEMQKKERLKLKMSPKV